MRNVPKGEKNPFLRLPIAPQFIHASTSASDVGHRFLFFKKNHSARHLSNKGGKEGKGFVKGGDTLTARCVH
jgi:hypothetical protein